MKRFNFRDIFHIYSSIDFPSKEISQVKPENQIYATVLNKFDKFYYSFFVNFSTVYLLYLLNIQNILLTRLYIYI